MLKRFSPILIILLLAATLTLVAQISANNQCRKMPAFVSRLNFGNVPILISTSDIRQKGIRIINANNPAQSYQNPQWGKFGYLGLFATDEAGNIFILPLPHINLIESPISGNNRILKIDSRTEAISVFAELPNTATDQSPNPYGAMAITYSCKNKCLYVSSVNGSTRKNEIGKIYQVDAGNGDILDSLTNFDAYGLISLEIDDKDILLSGNARNSSVYEISLKENGRFNSDPKEVLSIAGLGPRGDDKAKKLEYDAKNRLLIVKGAEFNYNLTAPAENQNTNYAFSFTGDGWKRVNN